MRNIITAFILTICAVATLPAQFVQGTLQGGPPAPGTKSRSPLNSLERAASNRYGATIMTDSFGNQRFTFYVSIWDTCLTYNPETDPVVGGPISVFVRKCETDSIWYIDYNNDVFFLGVTSGGGGPVENWYTVNDTTTDVTRTAYILQNAEWRTVDPTGYLDMTIGDLSYGQLYLDANESSLYHVDIVGGEFVRANANGVQITTTNAASRAVDITTDTINFVGSFDATRMQWNYLSDSTYMHVDSNKIVGFGQFPQLNNIQFDGTEKGFYYDPTGSGGLGGIGILNGSGLSGDYAYLNVDESSMYLLARYIDGTYSFIDNGINISSSSVASTVVEGNTGTLYTETGYADLDEAKWLLKINAPTDFNDTISFVEAYQNTNGLRNIRYSAFGEYTNANFSTVAYIGRSTSNATEQRMRSEQTAFGVQQNDAGGTFLFDWLKIDLFDDDTTRNAIQFYNDHYRWYAGSPSPTVGDTSFHYWAGNGTGTDPGFITLDQVCAHCADASAINIYNSNGYTTDNTRIDTIKETITFLGLNGDFGNIYPFRFEIKDPTYNEPKMMVWLFPSNDSLTLDQSDAEIRIGTLAEMVVWSGGEYLALNASGYLLNYADSTRYQGGIQTVTKARYISGFTPDVGQQTLKRIDADAASSGDGIYSNGTDWEPAATSLSVYRSGTSSDIVDSINVPSWATSVSVVVAGSGGGGGSGRRGAAGSVRFGGGGGGGGAQTFETFLITQLGSPTKLYYTVGGYGAGGAAVTTDNTSGAAGTAGSASWVSTNLSGTNKFISANGGDPGQGGSAAAGTGGTGATIGFIIPGSGGSAGAGGGAGGASAAGNNSGGGAGGGITSGDAASAGGNAGASAQGMYALISGGAIDTNGGSATIVAGRQFGQGGSGGGSSITTTGGSGGNAILGGGGGGGGASVNGNNSGAGGNGGAAFIQIIFKR